MTAQDCSPATGHSTPKATAAWWPALFLAGLWIVALVLLGYGLHGKPLAEKTLTALCTPVGILWSLVTGRLVQLIFGRPRVGLASILFVWLVLMIFGTRPVPRMLTRGIEGSVQAYNPERDAPLDVVVVLGGGTTQGPWRAQAGGGGDRLVMAAEMYHQGLTKQLITTGETTPGVSAHAPPPSEQTYEIWTRLNIDPRAIRKIGGQNTLGEMQSLKQIWPELEGKRVGVLTSGTHLPRAIRLAKSQGLDLVPIAADVRTAVDDWGLLTFIPSAGNFCDLETAQREIMASLVNR